MLECLPPPPPESLTFPSSAVHDDSEIHLHPSPMQQLQDASPRSTTSTINLSRIYYSKVLSSDSYKEMQRITSSLDLVAAAADQDHGSSHHDMLTQVLRPVPDHVHTALHRSKSNSLSNLISSYFQYSEETTSLCLTLRRSVAEARRLYCPIHHLPTDSDCDLVFQTLVKFNEEPNPFPSPNSQTFHEIRNLLCDLKGQLERRLRKSGSRIRLVRPPAAEPNSICCGGAAFAAYIPPKFVRRELAYAAQLKVASNNTFVLKTDLDTLDSLVGRLHNAVEDDKRFIRLGLNIGNDEHTVQEVLIQLRKNHQNLGPYLDLLEQKICTCFTTVNRSRSKLLEQILLHQNSSESSDPQ